MRKPRETGEVWESGSPRRGPPLPPPAPSLPLLSVRRCGHTDALFFPELGSSAPTRPGELWPRAPDALLARNIHETVLDAMKRLGGAGLATEQQLRGTPPAAPKPPARARADSPATPEAQARQGHDYIRMSPPRARGAAREERRPGSVAPEARGGPEPSGLGGASTAMEAQGDYVSMGGGEAKGYLGMGLPSATPPPPPPASPSRPLGRWAGSEYMAMARSFPEPPPRSSERQLTGTKPLPPGHPPTCYDSRSSRGSRNGHLEAGGLPPPRAPEPPREHVGVQGPDYIAVEALPAHRESSLHYVDLDLQARPPGYAKTQFGRLGEEEP